MTYPQGMIQKHQHQGGISFHKDEDNDHEKKREARNRMTMERILITKDSTVD